MIKDGKDIALLLTLYGYVPENEYYMDRFKKLEKIKNPITCDMLPDYFIHFILKHIAGFVVVESNHPFYSYKNKRNDCIVKMCYYSANFNAATVYKNKAKVNFDNPIKFLNFLFENL